MSAKQTNPTPRALKPEQKIAAYTLDRHLSVTAGPGAGKTFVLVERYLEILRNRKASIDNIVAITFTNRAANEMRERVRREIDTLLKHAAGDERRLWLRHKRALEGAVITTIHGFCSRILHEFPVEADIDPQFTLLDEHRAAMLLEAVVEAALTNAIQHGDELIVQLTLGATRAALAAALVQLYWRYRGGGLALEAIDTLSAANHASEKDYFAALAELDEVMNTFLSATRLTGEAEKKRLSASSEWPDLRALLADPRDNGKNAACCQAIENFRELRPNKNRAPGVERLDELLWGLNSGDRVAGKVPALRFDLLARDYSLALLKILRDVDRRLNEEKQRLSALDFDDLQLRTLSLLNSHPEVRARVAERYRFFLVDEFQDTNGLQRDLMTRMALDSGANLFVVGDRKQSIYGFRGADVDVFAEMTAAMSAAGGIEQPLKVNFRSQKDLISAFNFLFKRIFAARTQIPRSESLSLGFVEHDASVAERSNRDEPPLCEFLMTVLPAKRSGETAENDSEQSFDVREHDAAQVVEKINALVAGKQHDAGSNLSSHPGFSDRFRYGDIAILFRALTNVWVYESALRRAGIPYLTVQGKGFYQREEIADLIQLLRFLDNTTDELALAAVLRSPLCGLSDNGLLALRCAPPVGEAAEAAHLPRRNLLRALRQQNEIQFIDELERPELERAWVFLQAMIERRHRYGIAELLRYAVAATDYLTVQAANFDGSQRIANVERLFLLAQGFESTDANLSRDFVRYVEEFEAIGGRESEGQMDKSANVVHLMTIHQAKGQEFPVVIIPELHRRRIENDALFILDPRKGLSVKIPDGRGQMVRGAFLNELQSRAGWREEFESMRLLYVAATRAQDLLIFSGAAPENNLKNLTQTESGQWLAWLWQALDLDEHPQSSILKLDDDVKIRVTIDRLSTKTQAGALGVEVGGVPEAVVNDTRAPGVFDETRPLTEVFPLLRPISPEPGISLRRFSVTQLVNFQRCRRQYFLDRMLHAPGREELAVWNDAEAPEPPANLTATLKGAVIHRFCEQYCEGDDLALRLAASFDDVLRQRQTELAGRTFDINREEAVRALLPLARNYLASDVFKRATEAQRIASSWRDDDVTEGGVNPSFYPTSATGLWSELSFRLRRPRGILTGTIDKLLISPAADGAGLDVEIIDFKTNRFSVPRKHKKARAEAARVHTASVQTLVAGQTAQASFDFDAAVVETATTEVEVGPLDADSIRQRVEDAALDYQLQMQAYALAVRELLASGINRSERVEAAQPIAPPGINSLRATLHFVDPNVEISLPASLLASEDCVKAVDEAMSRIALIDGTLDGEQFPPAAAAHCHMCNFVDLCAAGSDWVRTHARSR